MTWRKQYATEQERKLDVVQGGWLFLFINIPLACAIWGFHSPNTTADLWWQIVPWGIQGAIFVGLLIFRPPMIVGYLTGFALCLLFPVVLAVLFLTGCLAGVAIAQPINWLIGWELSSYIVLPFIAIAMIGGLWTIGNWLHDAIDKWVYAPEEEQLLPKNWVPVPDITWENDVPEGKGGDDVG